ncbi:GAF domain-containing protein [Nocardia sp. NPDC020380]|uniref:GAF domain-containing protein n=1 Tax=Nocardia sp. NPDC020380 TaxID=3364309 RepID=UPI0037BDCAED
MTELPDPSGPRPADMPRHSPNCLHADGLHVPNHWVVVETLGRLSESAVILDDMYPRRFTKLNRATIAISTSIARELHRLVECCTASRRTESTDTRLPCAAMIRLIAEPIFGPYGQVRAVALWAGTVGTVPPTAPTVGVVEWDSTLTVAVSTGAAALLLVDQAPKPRMLPEMLSSLGWINDRSEFMALFRLTDPIDAWSGTAARRFDDGTRHQFHIVARASGTGANRTVRAIVCDTPEAQLPSKPDLYCSAIRHVPILRGHALALVDLNSIAVHDWVANDGDPIAGWCHHQPYVHPADKELLFTTCRDMLSGITLTAHIEARLRFDPADDWIRLDSRWTRVTSDDQPQALVDVTTIPPNPPSITDECERCHQLPRNAA